MKKLFVKKNFYLFASLFILGLFGYISFKTPLAGDDWGYALNGASGNPIAMALAFYNSWSGRFFSELWGMIIPGHKYLWNIINPLLFTGIFISLYRLGNAKEYPLLGTFFILAFMLSIDDNLRMETYTWIMGTTYVIPLLLSLLYFLIVEKIFKGYDGRLLIYSSNILLIVIGLMMENIAATMVGAIVILIVYAFCVKRSVLKYLLLNLLFSLASFIVMRLSPGSAFRLHNDNAAWVELSLLEKLTKAYPNFLEMTFINNNYAILLFSLVLLGLIIFSRKRVPVIKKLINAAILLTGCVAVFSFVFKNGAISAASLFSLVFWPCYVVNAFVILLSYIDDEIICHKAVFYLIVAGANAVVMLYSPIYGSRSALYTVYYLIVVGLLALSSYYIRRRTLLLAGFILLFAITVDRTMEYLHKYHLVGLRAAERAEVIRYYQEHPEDEEAWIPRFPIYTIHGADIEEGDTYHFETFKDYYQLPQSADKIIFYFVEDN